MSAMDPDKWKSLMDDVISDGWLANHEHRMVNSSRNASIGVSGVTVSAPPNITTDPASLLRCIAMRMRWSGKAPFEKLEPFKQAEKVLIWCVGKDQNVVLEDDWALFPSDGLITKLRLLEGA